MWIQTLFMAYLEEKTQQSDCNSWGDCRSAPKSVKCKLFWKLEFSLCWLQSNDSFIYSFRWRIGVDGMLWRPTTCSSRIITSARSAWSHLLLLLVFMFLLVYPLAATPLFPHVSSPRGPLLFGLVVYMP
jgi:hypothetical protein